MAKRAWTTARKWTPSPLEVKFEDKYEKLKALAEK